MAYQSLFSIDGVLRWSFCRLHANSRTDGCRRIAGTAVSLQLAAVGGTCVDNKPGYHARHFLPGLQTWSYGYRCTYAENQL